MWFTGDAALATFEAIVDLAEEWLDAGRSQQSDGRYHVAFEALRNAAELASKALILKRTGSFPQDHAVAGILSQNGLVPKTVDARDLHRLLVKHTLGPYGWDDVVHAKDVQDALRIAERMVAACRKRS